MRHQGAGPPDPSLVTTGWPPFEMSIAILKHIADWHLVLLNN
jgi:hypothetical protein